jgi:hypothetical protein
MPQQAAVLMSGKNLLVFPFHDCYGQVKFETLSSNFRCIADTIRDFLSTDLEEDENEMCQSTTGSTDIPFHLAYIAASRVRRPVHVPRPSLVLS